MGRKSHTWAPLRLNITSQSPCLPCLFKKVSRNFFCCCVQACLLLSLTSQSLFWFVSVTIQLRINCFYLRKKNSKNKPVMWRKRQVRHREPCSRQTDMQILTNFFKTNEGMGKTQKADKLAFALFLFLLSCFYHTTIF